ncbi:TPA: hypothetical protein QHR34_002628 [Raoultella ornithinolytica]|nr:hypothetical protein [Raoultella ornithinolytica]HDT1248495.1 hypothetical protein [Raoultella ornithinolytica]
MSVPNQTPYNIYTANGLSTVFAYEFYLISASDIQVTINGSEVSSGYTVSGVGNTRGGEVTFLTAPANGATVIFERVTPTYRLTDYQDNGDLLADTVNKDFDRLWMAIQRAFMYLGVALSRPLFGGGPFNATGYRIENLADPVNNRDAATKKFVVDNGITNLVKTLRVPEASVRVLPSVEDRAWKGLGFDGEGQPKLQDPAGIGLWGYVPAIGSFEKGSLLTQRFEVLLWESTDEYWRWDGAMPKVVLPGSTPATAGGTGKGKWIDVTDATLRANLGSGEPGMGSDMLAFRDLLGRSSTVGDYLRDAYIRVHSRYELLQAIEHINNDLQHPAEIRLARNFASWNDAKTDIDITYASIVGEGGNVVIDAQGIPDAAGNYFMRIFNSKKSDINNLANIFTVKQQGLTVIGPGRNSNVAFNVFQGSGFMTLGTTAQEFGIGDVYQQNAYIIKHIGRAIQRCVNHVWMPSGYSNYGEGIGYVSCLLSTSAGVGVRNDNPNGAIRLIDCSLDYMGRIAVTNGGRIEFSECHIEVNNASNKLTGIPFETASSERAEIIVDGGEILGNVAPLPESVPTIFRCGANTNGIKLTDVNLMKLVLPAGNYEINDGAGPFITRGVTTIGGGGNTLVPMLKSDRQNTLSDPLYTRPTIMDWYITQDMAEIKSRTAGYNLNLTVSADTSISGTKSMKVVKSFGVGSLSEIKLRVKAAPGSLSQYALYLKGAALTGQIFVEFYYATTQYQNQYGTPITGRDEQVGPTRTIDAATLADWVRVDQQLLRSYTPDWAEFMVIKITLSGMSAGSLYVDKVKVTNL